MPSIAEDFKENGYAVIPNFLNDDEVGKLRQEINRLVANDAPTEPVYPSIFQFLKKRMNNYVTSKTQVGDEYFLGSVDKIRYFYEAGAFDSDGKLIGDKATSINKIGHALHWLSPAFKRVSFSEKVKNMIEEIGYVDPVVVQSMYVANNATTGGGVISHQDGYFMNTTPRNQVVAVWIALEDVTKNNGCIWFQPGSHLNSQKGQPDRRFIRNPSINGPALVFDGDEVKYKDEKFVACPVPKGTCILIHGLTVHKHDINTGDKQRPAYAFHVADLDGVKWSDDNWCQPTNSYQFPSIYNN